MRLSVRILAALAFSVLPACSSTDPAPQPAAIQVTPLTVTLAAGLMQQLTVAVLDNAGQPLPNAPLTYASLDQTVATVNSSGLVTAVGPGATAITVTSAPASASIAVVVTLAGAKIVTVAPHTPFLTGNTVQLTATVKDSAGVPVALSVSYLSRDPTIATVSAAGLVTPGTVSGTTYVRASATGATADSAQVTSVVARVLVTGTVFGAAISSTNVGYVTSFSGTIVRVDPAAHTTGVTIPVGTLPTAIAFDAAGARAFVVNQGGNSVSVVTVATNTVTGTIQIPGVTPLSALVLPGDSLLVVGTDANKLYIVRLSSLAKIDSIAAGGVTNALAVRGNLLYANHAGGVTISEVNLTTRTVARTLTVGGVPQAMAVSSDGLELYVANEIGQFQIWTLSNATLAKAITLPGGGGFSLAVNPGNGLVYVGSGGGGLRVYVVDPVARTLVRSILVSGAVRRIAFTSNGSVGIVANEGGWVDFIK